MTQDRTRRILADNLTRLIEREAKAGQRPSVRAWAIGKGLDVRLITRLAKGQHAVTLDKLAEIADACGLQPWHLLYDELDPAHPPDAPISEDDRKMLAKLRRLLDQP